MKIFVPDGTLFFQEGVVPAKIEPTAAVGLPSNLDSPKPDNWIYVSAG